MDIPPVRDRRPLAVQVYDRLYDTLINADESLVILPPEEELARRLVVSRTTVRQALALLEEDGVIERGTGRRRQVAHRAPTPTGTVLPLEHMAQSADPLTVERIVRRVSPATGWSARLLEIERGMDIVTWESVVRAGAKVVASTLEVIDATHEPKADDERTMYACLGARYRKTAALGSLRLAPYMAQTRTWRDASAPANPVTITFTTRAKTGPIYLAKHVVDIREISLNVLADAHEGIVEDIP
ncbi:MULTISPECIES: GntR family transcriptional regulator [unclassified Microbacterium]|uniref:GntR family transcriptional regulator n=1 Tax=unclassified Microbacterium TaxID=2609290 RepID=UPI00144456DE|nr:MULTISPECIES: GntR family transcriptional regulator [unclassified Microbacterium]